MPRLPEVNLSEVDGVRHLHLESEWVQGTMRIAAPFDIDLEYVQRMMAWVLFMPPQSVTGGHAMQLGLGAGAITKFCYKKLRMTCTAIELNPRVADVCRAWFRLPPDDERLRVVIADAAREIQRDEWLGTVDALAVDVYDDEAAAPVLDSAEFYADCRRLLTDEGCMTVNLFGRSSSFERSLACVTAAFGERAVWAFKPTREGNTVVLAQRTPSRPSRAQWLARADEIEARWELPARKWIKVFKAISP
jgi:spermidine synthase